MIYLISRRPSLQLRTSRGWRSLGILVWAMFAAWPMAKAQITAAIDPSAARPGGIEGFVVNTVTGRAIEGAIIQVQGTRLSSSTTADGGFRLRNLFPGTQALKITADGMRSVYVADVAVQPGRTVHLRTIDLRPAPLDGVEELGTVLVNASQLGTDAGDYGMPLVPLAQMIVVPSHYAMIEDGVAAGSNLTRTDLESLPQNGEDLYRAISRLPGLAANDSGTRFWVRGAPNDQVLTRLDGVDLLEPFHVKGFDGALSVVDLETVSRLDLITGGFTAKYGNRMAGVLTLETENFEPAGPQNTLGASLTNARAINRGEFGGGRGSWLVEGRVGYPSWVTGDGGRADGDLETRYSDFTAKVEYRLSPDQGVSFHVLHSRDRLSFEDTVTPYLTSNYGGDYVWGRWRGKFGERVYGETVLSLAYLSWNHRAAGNLGNQYEVALKDFRDLTTMALRQDWTVLLSDRTLVQSGFEYTSGESTYTYHLRRRQFVPSGAEPFTVIATSLQRDKQREENGQAAGVFLAPRARLTSQLTIEPSVRFDHQEHTGDDVVSPRFNASFALGRTTLRGAWGIYYQSQGLHQLGLSNEDDVFHPAERAEHRVLSVEHRFVSGPQLRAEIYERQLSRIRPHWENLVNVDESFPEMKFDRLLLQPTKGVARGVELVAEDRSPGRFNWAVSYAWAKSTETINGRRLPRPRDQRHTFAVDASYAPHPKWRFSASWQYHTGWPSTEVRFYQFQVAGGGTVVIGDIGPAYAERLPAYHRLDLRVTRLMYLNKTTLRLYVDLFNAYNHENIQGFEYSPIVREGRIVTNKKAQRQISLTPNIGAVWEF